jgi:hypothetical protein
MISCFLQHLKQGCMDEITFNQRSRGESAQFTACLKPGVNIEAMAICKVRYESFFYIFKPLSPILSRHVFQVLGHYP